MSQQGQEEEWDPPTPRRAVEGGGQGEEGMVLGIQTGRIVDLGRQGACT